MAVVEDVTSPDGSRERPTEAAIDRFPSAEALLNRAVSENFTVASRVLPVSIRRHLMAIYGYARLVDYAGDDACGDRASLLRFLESELRRLYHGTPRLPLLKPLKTTVQEFGIPQVVLRRLIQANWQDQEVHRYPRFADLVRYCSLSANPVGELVLYIFGQAKPELIELSDQVCTSLQILEHCQDVAEDYRNGRIYVPAEDLQRFCCAEEEFAGSSASPGMRRLIWFEVDRARQMLNQGASIVDDLSGYARLAISGYIAGGRATVRAFTDAGHDPIGCVVRPNRLRALGEWAWLYFTGSEPSSDDRMASAYRLCEDLMRSEAKNFSYGIRLLPGTKRRAMSAVYSFARTIDDIGDGCLAPEEKLRELRQARRNLRVATPDDADPVLAGLADAAQNMALPLDIFDELISGCEADVHGARYSTFDELVQYCRCVAGSIGRLSLAVFGTDDWDAASRKADALGVALQLTNILRDVTEDRRNGRVYLPAEDLQRFGVGLELDESGMLTDDPDALGKLICFEAQRAREWYADGLGLLEMLDPRSRACCASMAAIYYELLQRIEADPETAMRGRVSLPGWRKAAIAAKALAGITR